MDTDDPAFGTYKAIEDRGYLDEATTKLKASPLFQHFSRRLLFDLAERNGVQFLDPAPFAPPMDEPPPDSRSDQLPGPFLALVVLEGTLLAIDRTPLPPDAEDISSLDAEEARKLRPGVHLRNAPALDRIPSGKLRLRALETSVVVPIGAGTLDGSPTAAWSLDLAVLSEFADAPAVQSARRPEYIWVSADPDTTVPVDAAMHILGAAVARSNLEVPPGESPPDTPVFLYILGPTPRRLVWSKDRFIFDEPPTGQDPLILGPSHNPVQHVRFFVGNPADPLRVPPTVSRQSFDRVVHVTTQLPNVLSEEAKELLDEGLQRGDESIFSSFIASVLVDYDPQPTHPTGLLCKGKFEALQLPCNAPEEPPTRPYRDACNLRADVPRLRRAWRRWVPGGHDQFPPFITVAADAHAMRDDTSRRWARAVVNRRVGVAISGGGASAYRAGPLLARIERAGIPIDVFAALSGGALIGAFYCGRPPNGFDFAKYLGPFFQATMPGVVLWTLPYEVIADILLGGVRIEDLEIRFAPVAVALPDNTVPYVAVVVRGTLGEAARVSGSLPPSFAPTTKNCIRYTDGGAGSLVPARVARDCGADVVLACNVIPGPSRGNPFSYFGPGAGLLRWTPWIGRWVDSYTWNAYLVCQSSREFGRQAEVFVEFNPQPFPLIESTLFVAAQCIVDAAENQGAMLDGKVADLRREWLKVQPPP